MTTERSLNPEGAGQQEASTRVRKAHAAACALYFDWEHECGEFEHWSHPGTLLWFSLDVSEEGEPYFTVWFGEEHFRTDAYGPGDETIGLRLLVDALRYWDAMGGPHIPPPFS
jgi:hypothetical protein